MFISNKEKSDINENIIRNKSQIDHVIKHVAKLQVDMGNSDIPHIAQIRSSTEQLQKRYFGAKDEIKKLQQQITMLREINDLIIEKITKLELFERNREKIVIPKEKVQEMKDAGTWEDPEKRGPLLKDFIKAKWQADEKKQRQRAYGRKYYLNKKAKKAEQKQQELL
jgi:hypothetical protein